MSLFKNMINNYNARKQEKEERKLDKQYINADLTSSLKNAYYKMSDNCDVFLRNPQEYNFAQGRRVWLEIDNVPTYVIKFSSLEKAQQFMKNNFFMGPEHQDCVDISLVNTVLSAAIIIKPVNRAYDIHIEVNSEEVGQKLVKMFRRQYIDNKNLAKLKGQEEIENLGIEFYEIVMLNPKQASYVNLGLKDWSKGIYYTGGEVLNLVYIDTSRLKTTPLCCIKFENSERAQYFAEDYISYDKCYFDVFAHNEEIIIEARRIDGRLQINCGENEKMAQKLVKKLRTQYIERLNREKQAEKSAREDLKQDFRGMKF
jgi:hypothetical protein